MKFGVFDHLDQNDRPIADQYDERLRLVDAYEASGWFHAFHMAEHHGTPLGIAPSPAVFLAAVAQRTTTLRFGAMVFTLAMYHPYRLFEELCMLDQLSRGRLDLGIGRGISPIELSFLGVDVEQANEIYPEALEILMRAFRGGELSYTGKHFTFDRVPIVMRPYQTPHPPLWYGITSLERTAWAADQHVNLMTNYRAVEARALADRFAHEWAARGNDPAALPFFGSTKHIVIAESDAEAVALARVAYARYTEQTTLLWRQRNIPRNRAWVDDFDEARAGGLVFAGSAATVRDDLAQFIRASGINYLACRVAFGDLSFAESKRSLELLTDRVLPDLAELEPTPA